MGECPAVGNPLYLDHASTAPPLPEALDAFAKASVSAFGNPGSAHQAGAEAARVLERSRKELKTAFGAEDFRVVWTSSGTESNHLAIQGLAKKAPKGVGRILFGAAEHPSARMAALALADQGFTVEELPVDGAGILQPETLEAALGEDVALVTVHWANNELGTLNSIAQLAALTRHLAPRAFFHTDAVQAVGKRPETLDSLGVDSAAVAAHKIGGVRGCAALLLASRSAEPEPMFLGGGQEGGLRSGTENVMGAAAFAAAATVRRAHLGEDPRVYLDRRRKLLDHLREAAPEMVVLGSEEESEIVGSILTAAFPGTRAANLLHHMEAEGVQVGSGSACNTDSPTISRVLVAAGVPEELALATLRFSLGGMETDEDLAKAASALEKARASLAV